jgi:Txe/YoeB family toxin of Txe-Axe toxin-antitoxin module
MEEQREIATKAVYAAIGAPVVTSRKIRELGMQFADDTAATFDEWAQEGKKVTERLQDQKVVEEVKEDFEHLQEQVEKLRDQLEDVLSNWRDTFVPAHPDEPVEKPAAEPVAKKTAAKKTAPKSAAPKSAAKKTTTRKTTAKKPVE